MTCLCGRADDERISCLYPLLQLLWSQVVCSLHIPRLLQKLDTWHSTLHSSNTLASSQATAFSTPEAWMPLTVTATYVVSCRGVWG